ncbi:hypothetical protein B0H13DRAFT_2314559 [Mycena leptocephala]|nr:hypothetical protein B0H13DRAFT_2314559 [Mycena leptocephala]
MAPQHVRECREWRAITITAQRKQTILERLIALGWSDEMEALNVALTRHELVDCAKPLTPDEWEDQVKPELYRLLNGTRSRAMRQVKRAAAMMRYSEMPSEKLEAVRKEQTRIIDSRDTVAKVELFRQVDGFLAPGVSRVPTDCSTL